jgi:molybdopterin converting factor small subunit
MKVRVVHFALMRELCGCDAEALSLPEAATVREAWRAICRIHGALLDLPYEARPAVNRRFASWDAPLAEGQELCFLLPTSGG